MENWTVNSTRETPTDNLDEFGEVLTKMSELYRKKNKAYGNAFSCLYKTFGLVYPLIHLMEKVNRLQSLIMRNDDSNVESIADSLIDVANYAVMTLVELNKQKSNELAGTKDSREQS